MPRCWDWSAWPPRPGSWGKDPLCPAGDLVTSCLALPDQCGNCIYLPRLPRPLGNVMRLLKWGPGPEGKRGPPPDRAGGGRSFPETHSGSADRDWLARLELESQTLRGWGGARCLGLPGAAWGEGVRGGEQTNLWWGSGAPRANQDGLLRALHVTKVQTETQRYQGTCPGSHSKVNRRYQKKPPVLLFQPEGLLAVLLPKNPQDTPNITRTGSGMREAVSYSASSPPTCVILV